MVLSTRYLTHILQSYLVPWCHASEWNFRLKRSFFVILLLFLDSFLLVKAIHEQNKFIQVFKSNEIVLEHDSLETTHVFIMNLNCENAINVLATANNRSLFSLPCKWILFHTDPIHLLKKYMKELQILVNSDVTLCQKIENKTVLIRKIFKYHIKQEIQIENFGYWNEDEGLVALETERSYIRRRNDLRRTVLNTVIVVINNDTLNHLTDKRDIHIDSITKVNYVLMNHLSDIINATFNYSIETSWGYKDNQSQWNGMIGRLLNKEGDIGGTPLFFTIDRVDVIDYIAMTTATGSAFIFREPKLSYVSNVFTLPFDIEVWASTVAIIIILAIFLYIILRFELNKQRQLSSKTNKEIEHRITVTDVALLSFGALCQQGSYIVPKSVPGRITMIILFISAVFLYTSYSANIVALLQSSSSSIRTLEDLLKSRIDVGVDDTVFNRFYFPNSKEPIRRALYQQKVVPPGKKPHYMPMEDGIKKIREGLFAFHVETGPGYKLIGETFQESEKCGLTQIKFLEVIDPWLSIQKNSSYKKLLKIGLRKLHENGIQNREVDLIYPKKPVCTARGSNFVSVGIVDCYPAVAVLAFGILASFIILLVEIILYREGIEFVC